VAQGRDAESIAADAFPIFTLSPPTSRPTSPFGTPDDIYAALYGPAHRFDPVAIRKKYQEKYGTPDLSISRKRNWKNYRGCIFSYRPGETSRGGKAWSHLSDGEDTSFGTNLAERDSLLALARKYPELVPLNLVNSCQVTERYSSVLVSLLHLRLLNP
jgi:hypothetical protein